MLHLQQCVNLLVCLLVFSVRVHIKLLLLCHRVNKLSCNLKAALRLWRRSSARASHQFPFHIWRKAPPPARPRPSESTDCTSPIVVHAKFVHFVIIFAFTFGRTKNPNKFALNISPLPPTVALILTFLFSGKFLLLRGGGGDTTTIHRRRLIKKRSELLS